MANKLNIYGYMTMKNYFSKVKNLLKKYIKKLNSKYKNFLKIVNELKKYNEINKKANRIDYLISKLRNYVFYSFVPNTYPFSITEMWDYVFKSKFIIRQKNNLNSFYGVSKFLPNINIFQKSIGSYLFNKADLFLFCGYGINDDTIDCIDHIIRTKIPCAFIEDGFIRSVCPPLDVKSPHRYRLSQGFILDTQSCHFSSINESLLIKVLNSDLELDLNQINRAANCIDIIRKNCISKYNFQPIYTPNIGRNGVKKVLVIDQAVNDLSVLKGVSSSETFYEMLMSAARENKDDDIIVKIHPDMILNPNNRGIRKPCPLGHFDFLDPNSSTLIDKYTGEILHENIYICRDYINPISLIEYVDKVYVCSSQMGFESLMCGKETHIFGTPFYSGWGIGNIRNSSIIIENRKRQRSIYEIFYITYIMFSRYFNQDTLVRCEIEDIINTIIIQRNEYFEKFHINSYHCPLQIQENKIYKNKDDIINIAFTFDKNYINQFIVAISSLLDSANETKYRIFGIHAGDINEQHIEYIHYHINSKLKKSKIEFKSFEFKYHNALTRRDITLSSYYRLFLPSILPDIDKIIYSDCDVLFRRSLKSVYDIELGNHFIAACLCEISNFMNLKYTSPDIKNRFTSDFDYRIHLYNSIGSYICASFIIFNLKKFRNNNIYNNIDKLIKCSFPHMDQDCINFLCKDSIKILPPSYNHIPHALNSKYLEESVNLGIIPHSELYEYIHNPHVIHFAGKKPWKDPSIKYAEIWLDYAKYNTKLSKF